MAGPCLNDTESVTLNRDVSGNIEADVVLDPVSGLEIAASGLRLNDGYGLHRTPGGAVVGTLVNVSSIGDQFPGVLIGPGGYVQVGDTWTINVQRQPAGAGVNGWVQVRYKGWINVEAQDIFNVNPFQGWVCEIERNIDGTGWAAQASHGVTGASAARHSFNEIEDIFLTDDLAHSIQARLVVRGQLIGNVVCGFVGQRSTWVRYL